MDLSRMEKIESRRLTDSGSDYREEGDLLKLPDDPENDGQGTGIALEDEVEEEASEDDRFIRCKQCMQGITRMVDRANMQGMHLHTFANPHGIVFEIGCFREAGGCRYAGSPTEEFTWFSGYAWRIAVCKKCMLHVGWLFTAPGKNSFYGLIIDRLVYPEKS